MSNNQPYHLADYLRALLEEIERWEPLTYKGIRAIANDRRAKIILENESASLGFKGNRFRVRKLSKVVLTKPYGKTDKKTCIGLLRGHIELSEAIMDCRLVIHGTTNEVIDICSVIELLIDASSRIPSLQILSKRFQQNVEYNSLNERRYRRERKNNLEEIKTQETAILLKYHLL